MTTFKGGPENFTAGTAVDQHNSLNRHGSSQWEELTRSKILATEVQKT